MINIYHHSLAEQRDQANLDSTSTVEVKKKRTIIRNPQPKLNPERLMGPRGIHTLEDVFKDWESKGKGKEFEDLDNIMGKLEHWAHRLFPKLPFDNVVDVIANRLGSKKTVATHMKKIRLGMVTEPVHVGGKDTVNDDDDEDVARYDGGDEEPDEFQELLNKAGGGTGPIPPVLTQPPAAGGLTEEQKERIRRNKELAAAKKREKLEREQREAEEEQQRKDVESQFDELDELERDVFDDPEPEAASKQSTEKESNVEMQTELTAACEPSSREEMQAGANDDTPQSESVSNSQQEKDDDQPGETLDLDQMMEQMDED